MCGRLSYTHCAAASGTRLSSRKRHIARVSSSCHAPGSCHNSTRTRAYSSSSPGVMHATSLNVIVKIAHPLFVSSIFPFYNAHRATVAGTARGTPNSRTLLRRAAQKPVPGNKPQYLREPRCALVTHGWLHVLVRQHVNNWGAIKIAIPVRACIAGTTTPGLT